MSASACSSAGTTRWARSRNSRSAPGPPAVGRCTRDRRPLDALVGWAGFAVLPWYAVEAASSPSAWLFDGYPLDEDAAPALFLVAQGPKPGWRRSAFFLLLPLLAWGRQKSDPFFGRLLLFVGAAGLLWLLMQGFGIGLRGWRYAWLTELFGTLDDRQFGMGYGALLTAAAFLFLFTLGIAARGAIGGDVFVVGAIGFVIAVVSLFVFMPILQMLAERPGDRGRHLLAARLRGEALQRSPLEPRLPDRGQPLRRRVELALPRRPGRRHLDAARPRLRAGRDPHRLPLPPHPQGADRAADHHPGLRDRPCRHPALRPVRCLHAKPGPSSSASQPTRWVYGLPGLLIAQSLAFTPIAFLVLIGVVEGVSPSMEEAAQTLRASRWQTFVTVTLPLMRPGLANAFLIGFIESMADFGNPAGARRQL